MNKYWFQHDTTTGVIYPYLQEDPPGSTEQMQVIGPFTEDEPDVLMAYMYSARFTVQNGVLAKLPYFTIDVHVADGLYNVTAQLNATTTVQSCNFLIYGNSFSVPIENGAASLNVNIHKVVTGQSHVIVVEADGCLGASVTIGGTAPCSNVTAKQQPDGSVLIKSTSKQEITAYYMVHNVSMPDMLTDIANWVDLLTDITMKLVDASGLTLSDAEKTAVSDIHTSLMPNLRLTLAAATMSNGNPRFAQIVTQKAQVNANADEYLAVIADPDVK